MTAHHINRDWEEVKEEWRDFIGNQHLSNNRVADWWIDKFSSTFDSYKEETFWAGYDAGVDKQIGKEHLSPQEATELLSQSNKGDNIK